MQTSMFGFLDLRSVSLRGQSQHVVVSQIDKGGSDFARAPSRSSGHLGHCLEGWLDRLLAGEVTVRTVLLAFGCRDLALYAHTQHIGS